MKLLSASSASMRSSVAASWMRRTIAVFSSVGRASSRGLKYSSKTNLFATGSKLVTSTLAASSNIAVAESSPGLGIRRGVGSPLALGELSSARYRHIARDSLRTNGGDVEVSTRTGIAWNGFSLVNSGVWKVHTH